MINVCKFIAGAQILRSFAWEMVLLGGAGNIFPKISVTECRDRDLLGEQK